LFKKSFRVVIMSSTRGTDFGAMLTEKNMGKMKKIEFVGLVADKNCGAIERAKAVGIPTVIVNPSQSNFQKKLIKTVRKFHPDLICLVGWMRILQSDFCTEFSNKILNVHPSLLPKFAGKKDDNIYNEIITSGEKKTGMTIHFVTAKVDTGPIICQKEIIIEKGETAENLRKKTQAIEKKWYPEVIRWFRDKKIYF